MKKLAIIGSGDLGQLISHHANTCEFEIAGFFDDYITPGTMAGNYPVLGKIDDIETCFSQKKFDVMICAVGYKHIEFRASVFLRFMNKIPFTNVIHPNAYVDRTATLNKGIFILPGCVLDHKVIIGNNVLLNTGCVIAHDSIVDDHSFLSPTVSIAGFTKIGKKCVLGINTTVIDNITTCDMVQTGAGSVVTKNITKPGLYFGVPAKLIKPII